MSKLVNLQLTRSEVKQQMAPPTLASDAGPRYPWGLTLTLDTETLEKLGYGAELPDVDDTVLLIAKADVVSVSSHDSQGGKNRSVTLQITDLCLEEGADADDAKTAAKLYAREG